MASKSRKVVLAMLLAFCLGAIVTEATTLKVGYYKGSCPDAEKTIRSAVAEALKNQIDVCAGILRLYFHDCFVEGCDGSILLDPTPSNPQNEKASNASSSLHGFEVINAAKAKLEKLCPETVSCADTLAYAARDCVKLYGGDYFELPGGRLDGKKSILAETAQLPIPFFNLTLVLKTFAAKGFKPKDVVDLLGVHTIGLAHCNLMDLRIFNFSKNASIDPKLDPNYAKKLQKICPLPVDHVKRIPMDPLTPFKFDNKYYINVINHRGFFTSDAAFLDSKETTDEVKLLAGNPKLFQKKFADAMVKLGYLLNLDGEIRRDSKFSLAKPERGARLSGP